MTSYKNILVVRSDRVGDVVLTTPALAALREAFPQATISVLATSQTREIVEGNPHINEVIVDDRKGAQKGFGGFFHLVGLLRKKNFDLAVIFHTKKRTNLLCFLAGIPTRLGYRNNKFGFLLTKGVKDIRMEGNKHEAEYCLELLKHIGVESNNLKLHVSLKRKSEDWARQFIKDNNISDSNILIAVHPGASCISKRWPARRFAEVIDAIQFPVVKIILVGTADNEKIAKEIRAAVQAPIIDLTGLTSIGQLASLLKRCRLLISNDSGPVHIAAAMGTPVISIFGRNQAGLSPRRWGPLGQNDVILHKEVGCEICLAHNCMIDFECLKAIKTQDVLDATKAILKPVSPSS